MSVSAAETDVLHLARALQLAERGLYTTDPNPRVGCVLAKGERVVGEGWHERAGGPHAEVQALRAAGSQAAGATAYVTLEPCSHVGRTPPCADALIAAGITRVVACVADPSPKVNGAGFARLRDAGIEVSCGLLEREARALNPGFFARVDKRRPFVRLKLAMSVDGRTALHNGQSQWITGEAARTDVQRYRARSSAILTGAGTVRADDPQLNVRLNYGAWVRQPLRVVLDARLSLAPDAKVFAGGDCLVFAAEGAAPRPDFPAEVARVPEADGALNLPAVLDALAAREINEVLVECGARLAASFLQQRLVDEWILYMAPVLFGSDGRALTALQGVSDIASAPRFTYADVRRIGEDLRLILQPKQA